MKPIDILKWLVKNTLPEQIVARIKYYYVFGRFPDEKHPKSFNEKVHWRKFFERNPQMGPLVDKIEAKHFVEKAIGADWVIPTYFSGETLPPVSERNWPFPYIIKSNHRSGDLIIVRGPDDIDWPEIDAECRSWVKATSHSRAAQEWAYSLVKPKILVEEYIGGDVPPNDYKFLVFDSRVHYIQVDVDRFGKHHQAFYDRDWVKQPFYKGGKPFDGDIPAPKHLSMMIEAAERLGHGWGFVRVDLYDLEDHPKFGELTFYPAGGMGKFRPHEWDEKIGGLWAIGASAAG